MNDTKAAYRQWSKVQDDLPLFFHSSWLDLVCGEENWSVVLVEQGGQIVGVLPFFLKTKWGQRLLVMPPLTPYLGPWLIYPKGQKRPQKYAFEKRTMQALIDQLPPHFLYQQRWFPSIVNWLPFHWQSYQQRTYYTYIINDLSTKSSIYSLFKTATRNNIRVALSLYEAKVSSDIQTFYSLNKGVFDQKKIRIPYSFELLNQIYQTFAPKGQASIYLAHKQANGAADAGIFIVKDHHQIYLLATARRSKCNSGIVAMLIWQALQDHVGSKLSFNFEGSIIPSIESFFRGFGGELTPYYLVWKIKYRWVESLKIIWKG